jgi:hypothetical protein
MGDTDDNDCDSVKPDHIVIVPQKESSIPPKASGEPKDWRTRSDIQSSGTKSR